MPITSDKTPPPDYTYRTPVKPKPKRVWLAIIVCGIVAAVTVTIIAVFLMLFAQLFTTSSSLLGNHSSVVVQGAMFAIILCVYNLLLFPIVLPVTWGGLALTLGRLRWKGENTRKKYFRRGIILGASLVGLTTGLFGGGTSSSFSTGIFAGITGACIGALAGAACTYIFLLISIPVQQAGLAEVEAFS